MPGPEIRPDVNPAAVLALAIEQHRDDKYEGHVVDDSHDLSLYTALVWYQTEYESGGAP